MKKPKNIVKIKAKSKSVEKMGKTQIEHYAVAIEMFEKGLTVSRGNVKINVKITQKHIEITGASGKQFIFRSTNDPKTLKRWDEVIGCLQVAVRELKKARKL